MIDNNGDGVDGECGGPSISPLSHSTCLAVPPTSPIRGQPFRHRAGVEETAPCHPPRGPRPVLTRW
jgi:hypothetical protein